MAKYSSPIFGSMNFTPWSVLSINIWEYFDIINRASEIKKNSKGQVYGGDVFIEISNHGLSSTGSTGGKQYSYVMAGHFLSQKTLLSHADQPLAWLAMPARYGNAANTAENSTAAANAWAVETYHTNSHFIYYLFCRSNGASVTNTSNQPAGNRWGEYVQRIIPYRGTPGTPFLQPPIQEPPGNLPQPFLITREKQTVTCTGFYGLDYWLNDINLSNNIVQNNSYTNEFGLYDAIELAKLNSYFANWKLRSDSVYANMRVITSNGLFTRQNNMIGSNIITGIPVFTLENFSQMVAYFQDESWTSDNGEPPPSDWSTDWDIYIKGAQKPSIFITMKSDKVDEWLGKLDENTSGIEKGDIAVEYRYRYHEINTSLDSQNYWNMFEYTLKSYAKDQYNSSRETDYRSNAELNYERFSDFISEAEFAEGGIQDAFKYPCELEFRIMWNKYRSSWCRYEIGVIGSPSIPDFSKMNNIGEVITDQDMLDNSTVTLHYDEYPPGYDPYPDVPTPDLPPVVGGDTDPTPVPPGLNGLGLLTETYKISTSTAEALGRFFWGGDLFQKIKALNTSPIENVVGLITMPIDIEGTTDVIVIGDVDTNLNGDKITQVPLYELGTIELKGRYKSFLDFEPYTSAFLYLPFVGFVRINPAYFTNKTLKVVYSYDIVCGLCNAMLFADGIFIESHQGHCGINIPLIATNRADLQIGLASSLLETGASVATAGAITGKTAAGAGIDVVNAAANYATGFHSSRQTGYSPSCIWGETRTCFLVIESVNAAHSSTYNHDRGRPTLVSANVGSLRGYTEIDAGVDLSSIGQASEEEKNMLRSILASGFYV